MTVLLILALLAGDDKAATDALDQFKTGYKAKDAPSRAKAVEELAKTQHDKVTARLASILATDEKEVRCAAAKGLGDRTDEKEKKKAGLALSGAFKPNEKLPEVLVALIAALGKLRDEAGLPEVHKQLEADTTEVVQAAVEACVAVKSTLSFDPLIKRLKEIDEALKPREPGAGGRGGVGGGRLGGTNSREAREMARTLQPVFMKALAALGSINCENGKDWEDWWKEHRATFKIQK